MIITNPFSTGTWTREPIDNVSNGWWVLLLPGVVSVLAVGTRLFTDWTIGNLASFELQHMSVRRSTIARDTGARTFRQPHDVAAVG